MKKVMPFVESEDLKTMIEDMLKQSIAEINLHLSSLLDINSKETKLFLKEFIERIENYRKYEENAKKVQNDVNKLNSK